MQELVQTRQVAALRQRNRHRLGSVAVVEHGSGTSLAHAYERHAESVRRTAYSVVRDSDLADDVTQDVFLAIWVRPERYDPGRGTLESLLRVMAGGRPRSPGPASRRSRRSTRASCAAPSGGCPRSSVRRSRSPTGAG